jgi:exosortase A
MFWQTSASLVATWNASGTYSHGFLIVPAFLWLVWTRRQVLARLPVRPSWWALPVLAVLGAAWLAAQWTSLALPAQFAAVAMVPTATAATLGVAWVRALLFPFVFLFFAVPFGESWVPILMDWTADFTVAALKLSGVPVYRDGLHFAIPSGNWSVVDSCSGIRYLFACLSVSSLYGWTIYRGTARRLLFIGCALVIAIVANWIRAYGIVMLGHLSNNQIATGADHLVYGGVFFGIIMALVFALGAVWREDHARPLESNAAGVQPEHQLPVDPAVGISRRVAAVLATVMTLLVWPTLSSGSLRDVQRLSIAVSDIRSRGGWSPVDEPVSSWQPRLNNPLAVITQSFEKDSRRVGVHLGLFERPTPQSKLTSGQNRLLEPDGLNPQWKLAKQGVAQARWGGETVEVTTGVLIGAQSRLLAWHWYWVDGHVTASPGRAAMLQMLARLRGRSETSAWVSVYAIDESDPLVAPRVLGSFIADMSASIGLALAPAAAARLQAAAEPDRR